MSRLFRAGSGSGGSGDRRSSLTSSFNGGSTLAAAAGDLPSPFPTLAVPFTADDLRECAYEIFVAASRSTGGRPLTYIPQASSLQQPTDNSSASSPVSSSSSSSLQRSLTSAAASKMKKALGLKSSPSSSGRSGGGGGSGSKSAAQPATVAELVRVQMRVSEQADTRIRRGLLRIAAGQLGKRVENMVLPLEFLQQFKSSDFSDLQDYDSWLSRNLKLLEAGLLQHPLVPLEKSDISAQRLKQILRGTIETGRNSESMQSLRSVVMSLSSRSYDGSSSEPCHWADGSPLNLHLYQMLLETFFDIDDGSMINETDELLETVKKTWIILGINQTLHNLCFVWVLFSHFVSSGQEDMELLSAADSQLAQVAKDAKATKDSVYCNILSSVLTSIMGWTEKRLLAYHETFNSKNIETMQGIVSIGVTSAKTLVEDISNEYRRKRKEDSDVARSRVEIYIRSSLRTAFAQRMEQADTNRRSMKNKTSSPVLSILAADIGDLAKKEKEQFSPVLKNWHPLAAGVAVATLHSCFGNELKQFIAGMAELTPDSVQVLKAADKLEEDLVNIAVEDSVDSDDGGKSLIREMPPYEAESAIANLAKSWIKARVDKMKEWVDRNLQQETWKPKANRESIAQSGVEMMRTVDETLEAFFHLPIPMHLALLPDLTAGLDRSLQHYVSKIKSGCGTRNTYLPTLPALTRCEVGSKLFRKKEKPLTAPNRGSQVGSTNGNSSLGLPQLAIRMNTVHHIRSELENLEKKIKICLRNVESAQTDITDGVEIKFDLSQAACQEGIHQLCETIAYKVVFHDLNHVLYEGLYVGDLSSSRIDSFLKELDPILETLSRTVHDRVRSRVLTALLKASYDGFLLVLLAGGPCRAFTLQDSETIQDDYLALRALFLADGDGLPEQVVDKAATQLKNVLPLFSTDSDSLVERYKRLITDSYGPAAKTRMPLPATTANWSPAEANTVLRVLCYRNDEAATKFLKKTYGFPKKL